MAPTIPSGVQFARPIVPPGVQTRSSSAAARDSRLVGGEHHTKRREHDSEPAGGGRRRVAAPTGDIEHGAPGTEIDRFAGHLTDDRHWGRDGGESAACLRLPLAVLDGPEVQSRACHDCLTDAD